MNSIPSPILARSPAAPKPEAWRDELRHAFRDAGALLDHLQLEPEQVNLLGKPDFPILIPRPFASRMEIGNPADPLLLQVLPHWGENDTVPGFVSDPVGDRESRAQRGLLHKYRGRILLITTGACAVHCRYCFRQAYPYGNDHFDRRQYEALVQYLQTHPDIEEVILSGGDPLMLDTTRLQALGEAVQKPGTVRRLRLHTRVPIVLPSRVNQALVDWLSGLAVQPVVVVHANHPAEFDSDVDEALKRLRHAGAMLFNQAVLLADINDRVDLLAALMRRGFEAGVVPYYLHLLDRVEGAARYECDTSTALDLMEQLRRQLSGYLVPKLVREQAGAPYKLPVL
jgi:EF-P beta-lysylation protein EpmB